MALHYANREEYLAARIAKRRKKAARKGYAPERAELRGPVYVPEGPADGIEKKVDRFTKHERWKVINPNVWDGIAETVLARAHNRCEGCGLSIDPDAEVREYHLHHIAGRGAGKRCDCPDHLQLLCASNPRTGAIGCHELAHKKRLGERFKREDAA